MHFTKILIFALYVLICFPIVRSAEGREEIKIPLGEIGIDDVLFAPSAFITTTKDNATIFGYMRTNLEEGESPTDVEQTVRDAEKFAGFRLKSWGIVVGWQGDKDFDLMEPYALSVDYKVPFRLIKVIPNTAIDFRYSTKKITGSNLRRSILDFGVISITGIMSKKIASYSELYGGVSANYVYFDASSKVLDDLWRYVPLAGLRVCLSKNYNFQFALEASRGRMNSDEDPIWAWNLGAAIGF